MLLEINDIQYKIMLYVKLWVNTQKTPVAQSDIIKKMQHMRIKDYTVVSALDTLLRKGYIRKAYSENRKRTYYVMIRNL